MQEGKIQPKVAMRAPGIPAILIPTKSGRVYSNWSRCHFCNCNQICEFTHGQPTVRGHYLILYEGHCSVTATDTKHSKLAKNLKIIVNRS